MNFALSEGMAPDRSNPRESRENSKEGAKEGVKATREGSPAASPEGFEQLQSKIHTLRGQQVMLDEDLAGLYGVEVRIVNRAVKRNATRFPLEFCFHLTQEEEKSLRCQIGTLRFRTDEPQILRSQIGILRLSEPVDGSRLQNATLNEGGWGRHRKYLPYAFTEQGVAMLSAVLRSETAVRVSIGIMQAFVAMRRVIHAHAGVLQRLDGMERRQVAFETETDRRFEEVFDALEGPTPPRQGIFFDGQVHDAHAFVSDLIRGAQRSIVLLDNYVDDSVLTLLSKRSEGVSATVYTRSISPTLALDLEKHNAQYPPVEIKTFADAHDRFLILDGDTVYHLGASLKDLGKKWFAFSRFDKEAVRMLERLAAGSEETPDHRPTPRHAVGESE